MIRVTPFEVIPGELLGRYKGEFLLREESRPGTWRYHVRAVDIAGNASPISYVDLVLRAPDNYVLIDSLDNVIPLGTVENATPLVSEWIAPVCPDSWEQHFLANGWRVRDEQVSAGFPLYIQPGCLTPALFVWEHDFGAALPSVQITMTPVTGNVADLPDTVVKILSKETSGGAWIDHGEFASILLPGNTQFVRVETRVATDVARTGIAAVDRIGYELSLEQFTDGGEVTITDAAAGAVVTFARDFADVLTVQVSAQSGGTARYADYLLDASNDSMVVKAYNATGVLTTGVVSWFVRGVG